MSGTGGFPMPHANHPIAHLDGAVKRYGPLTALDGVDLQLFRGELLALLGPNGAGKTTAIGLLLGLIRADAGSVALRSEECRVGEACVRTCRSRWSPEP